MKKPVIVGALVLSALTFVSCGRPSMVDSVTFPSRSAVFLKATTTYGPLFVREGETFKEALVKPWSAWWYPYKQTTLFEGDNSPLVKFDRYMDRAHGTKTESARYERENFYEEFKNGDGWEGLCNAWAAASLLEDEPKRPVEINGVNFSVGDLKALIIKSYEVVDGLEFFGQRYDGRGGDDYLDIYPDQFHRVIQAELFEKGRPFIMDKDPGLPVWNTPIYRAQSRVSFDPYDSHLAHVETWLTGVDTVVKDLDAVEPHVVNFQYTYDLYGRRLPDGRFDVKYGAWTGDSANYHPDFLTVIPRIKKHHSLNQEIDAKYVDEILARTKAQLLR